MKAAFEVGERSVKIDYNICSTCCQCISVCPTQALLWDGAEPLPLSPGRLPSAEQLAELFGQKRTIREFK